MPTLEPKTQAWLDQVVEDVIEPDLPIVDPHHHLWRPGMGYPYSHVEFAADLAAGHRIEQAVFMECGSSYRTDGPDEFKVVGESEFIAEVTGQHLNGVITALVAHADLTLPNLDAILDAHVEASNGMFRGIRDALSVARYPETLAIPGHYAPGKAANPAFRAGVRRLGERGYTYDSWHYHYQISEFTELARAVPGTLMVHDHFGTPCYVGPFASQKDEIFAQWKQDITELAKCENVVAKIGGLAMPDNGIGWNLESRPPTSDEFLAVQAPYYLHTIEAFGPDRCMFESNFPVDKVSLSYRTLWNAYKKMTAGFTPAERTALFSGTAKRVYRLP